MKVLAYLFAFVLILGVVVFGFFTMTMPHIPQTTVARTIDPADAFATTPAAQPTLTDVAPAAP